MLQTLVSFVIRFVICFCAMAVPTVIYVFDRIPAWELQDGVNRIFALVPWLSLELLVSLFFALRGSKHE